jgi:pyridoxamine 5'-phosphate oxidase
VSFANPPPQLTERGLSESDAHANPFDQFRQWLDEARVAKLHEPDAMTLATASADGVPAARLVLLRGVDERGFVFFTNRRSRKALEMSANARAALVFYWAELDRQVRIEGAVEWVSDAESDAYFRSRPRDHQLSAWASAQSEVIPDRACLEREMEELTTRFAGLEVPRPPHWGGYRVVPESVEFWQRRPSRLHDRLIYRRQPDGRWLLQRLSP